MALTRPACCYWLLDTINWLNCRADKRCTHWDERAQTAAALPICLVQTVAGSALAGSMPYFSIACATTLASIAPSSASAFKAEMATK